MTKPNVDSIPDSSVLTGQQIKSIYNSSKSPEEFVQTLFETLIPTKTPKVQKSEKQTKNTIKIYTDGSYFNNEGGWAAVWSFMGQIKAIWGYEHNTTNNRQEIMGVLESLKMIQQNRKKLAMLDKVVFYSDSQYVVKTCNGWLKEWIRKGKSKKNMDLWNEIWQLQQDLTTDFRLEYVWIKGHSQIPLNEKADHLAGVARTSRSSCKKLEDV